MNVHHLELFYYVAKHGGISEAVRNIPYGIQQPAVSGQVIQLEEYLGVTLFQRRPFQLTPAGRELFDFISPFFANLNAVATKLQGGIVHHVRIGASEIVLRDHLPEIVQSVRKKFPQLRISLRESNQLMLELLLQRRELDLAITIVQEKTAAGLSSEALLKLPMALLVPKNSKLKSADELWKRDKIDEPLITLPPNEIVCRHFQAALTQIDIDWFPSVEVSTLNLIEAYVAKGYGIGLTVKIPNVQISPDVRMLELTNFPAVAVGAVWQGKLTPLMESFLDEFRKRASQFAG